MESRNDQGQFSPTHTDAEVVAAVRAHAPAATSEVATELGISRQGADYRLRQLRETGHITSKKIGASLVWFIPSVTSTTESDPDSPHEQAFEDFGQRATEAIGEEIQEIILYGSTARGETQGTKSDVDIFVVIESASETVEETLDEIAYDVMVDHGVVTSLMIKTEEEFESQREDPFVQTVLQEGRSYV
jgi:predicted nucleotidyltransferase